jgi:hypothetical protein
MIRTGLFIVFLNLSLLSPAFALTIPQNIEVPFVFESNALSNQLKEGDKILVKTMDDVTVQGITVFQKGVDGIAVIKKSSRARLLGTPGQIIIEHLEIPDVQGVKRHFTVDFKSTGSVNFGTRFSSYLLMANPLTLPFAGLFAGFKGKETTVPEGKIFTAHLQHAFEISDPPSAVFQAPSEAENDDLHALIKRLEAE